MQKLPHAYQFYFDVRLLMLKAEDEARGTLRESDIFSKARLVSEITKDI